MSERWRAVVGYEKLYEVSDQGRVRSLSRMKRMPRGPDRLHAGQMRKSTINSHGYPCVCFGPSQTFTVHILVARAFLGEPAAGEGVRHIDGDRTNPALANLCYGTPAQNNADKIRHGTSLRGEQNPTAKLTERDVVAIRRAHGRPGLLARVYGVNVNTIYRIRTRQSWTHVQ